MISKRLAIQFKLGMTVFMSCLGLGSGGGLAQESLNGNYYNGEAPEPVFPEGNPTFSAWTRGGNWETRAYDEDGSYDRTIFASPPTNATALKFTNLNVNPPNYDPYQIFVGAANAGSLEFLDGSVGATSSYSFGTVSAGHSLTLGANNGFIKNSSTGNHVFNTDVSFIGAGSQSIINVSSGSLVFNGAVSAGTLSIGETSGAPMGSILLQGNVTATQINVNNSNVQFNSVGSARTISSQISVEKGGTLSGSNVEFTGATAIGNGGNLLASKVVGDSLNFSGGLELQEGSKLSWSLDSGVPINVGSLNFSGDFLTIIDISDSLDLQDLSVGKEWVVFQGFGSNLTGLPSNNFELSGADIGLSSSMFSWVVGSGTISLSVAAVPEPSTMVLLGVAGAIGGVVARRRAKRDQIKDTADSAVTA